MTFSVSYIVLEELWPMNLYSCFILLNMAANYPIDSYKSCKDGLLHKSKSRPQIPAYVIKINQKVTSVH